MDGVVIAHLKRSVRTMASFNLPDLSGLGAIITKYGFYIIVGYIVFIILFRMFDYIKKEYGDKQQGGFK